MICPRCNEREVAEGRYVYVLRNGHYPREPRCELCYEGAASEALDRAIKASRNWENYCGPDVRRVGSTTYYKTTTGTVAVEDRQRGRD